MGAKGRWFELRGSNGGYLKINIECLGLPTLAGLIGKNAVVDFNGGTVLDLIGQIVNQHGSKARAMLLDQNGVLDYTIQVMINAEGFVGRKAYATRALKDGDTVRFLLIAGGG